MRCSRSFSANRQPSFLASRQKLTAAVSEACPACRVHCVKLTSQRSGGNYSDCGVHIFVANSDKPTPPTPPPQGGYVSGCVRPVRSTRNLCADSTAFPASFDTNRRDTVDDVFKALLALLSLDQSSTQALEVAAIRGRTCAVVVKSRLPHNIISTGYLRRTITITQDVPDTSSVPCRLGVARPPSYIRVETSVYWRSSTGFQTQRFLAPATSDTDQLVGSRECHKSVSIAVTWPSVVSNQGGGGCGSIVGPATP